MRDPDRRRKMGQAGRERGVGATVPVAHFSVERMVAETEALYEELIREKMGLLGVE